MVIKWKDVRQAAEHVHRARTRFLHEVKEGLWPPCVELGPRNRPWMEHELDEVLGARIRGASDEEVKVVVKEIVERRQRFGIDEVAA